MQTIKNGWPNEKTPEAFRLSGVCPLARGVRNVLSGSGGYLQVGPAASLCFAHVLRPTGAALIAAARGLIGLSELAVTVSTQPVALHRSPAPRRQLLGGNRSIQASIRFVPHERRTEGLKVSRDERIGEELLYGPRYQ